VLIDAVLFDLDDTLYAQADWLAGAWKAVAMTAASLAGIDASSLEQALVRVASEGSGRGHIIDRALDMVDARYCPITPLLTAFRAHAPERLAPYPGAVDALRRVTAHIPIGLVSDGDVEVQKAKLRSLRLEGLFVCQIWSDELGREYRKPHPAPFQRALATLHVRPERAIFIGDRPDKDVEGARRAGMPCIRVRSGEYADQPDHPHTWLTVGTVVQAVAAVLRLRDNGSRGPSGPPVASPSVGVSFPRGP
jgi:putative hydrolase of the HAD superfamily